MDDKYRSPREKAEGDGDKEMWLKKLIIVVI